MVATQRQLYERGRDGRHKRLLANTSEEESEDEDRNAGNDVAADDEEDTVDGEHEPNDSDDDMSDAREAFCAGWRAQQRAGGIRKARGFHESSANANVNPSGRRTASTLNPEKHNRQDHRKRNSPRAAW